MWTADHFWAKHDFRNDGNGGHATIDFGGQWLMGRMLVKGYGQHLYDRKYQREVLTPPRGAYPIEDEILPEERTEEHMNSHDATDLMSWFMGNEHDDPARENLSSCLTPLAAMDDFTFASLAAYAWSEERLAKLTEPAVGGPLYPPINAFVYYPLGQLSPHWGYHAIQIMHLVLALVGGLGVRHLSQGRIWWPVAVTAIVGFPGFTGTIDLGQNAILTLTILIWGWALLARGRPVAGGIDLGIACLQTGVGARLLSCARSFQALAILPGNDVHRHFFGCGHPAGRRLAQLAGTG